ncbi:hypothetical protein [Dermabacter hominis]|uniref:hypothetical protein n=1 Tax=Dermabacter hominis TaxID=36740 RepID=UPI002432A96F|nr:hypothetical protein [Dermabacter hominis]
MKTESPLLAVIAAAALFAFSLANPAFAETQEFTQAQEQSVSQRGDGSMRASGGSITKCTVKTFSGGSSHRGCLVKMSTVVYVAVFNAGYTLVNGNSYISSADNWGCAGFGCSIETTGITKRKADLNGPAQAEMRVRVAVGPFATTSYLQLFVKGSRAWTN